MFRLHPSVSVAATLCLWIAGCDSSRPYGDVRGEVMLDKEPVKEGVIRFTPIDGKTPTASALIADGRFEARVPVATHRVEISAAKLPEGVKSYKEMKRGTVDEGEALGELIPERYNRKSELKIQVKPGSQDVPFHLKSKR